MITSRILNRYRVLLVSIMEGYRSEVYLIQYTFAIKRWHIVVVCIDLVDGRRRHPAQKLVLQPVSCFVRHVIEASLPYEA